jgi:response regulator RpfG family c-di-GMP phosphodiesterase
MKYMINSAKKAPGLKNLLKRLLKNKAGYLFNHSQFLTYVSAHIMDHLDWGNEAHKEKLQFISFFHDIALQNSEQAKIHSEKELKSSSLNEKEKDLVKRHAQVAATVISKYPNSPVGVEQIIKQHHGVANGLGFSEHYSQNISPMAIVFILAEDLVGSLIEPPKDFSYKVKISEMRETYPTQRFKKIIDTLETLTL